MGNTITVRELKKIVAEELASFREDFLPGGLGDNMSIEDIAKKHGVPAEQIVSQIKKGAKVEKEHTNDVRKAVEISMDHLTEDPSYYDKLDKMEHPNG